MLVRLEIKDFALIDRIEIMPSAGLNVLTGETGAGKSIVIDAISAIAGERTSKDMIRSGSETATIEAVFRNVSGRVPQDFLDSTGIRLDPGEDLLVGREISISGRNLCRINGRLVPLSILKEMLSYLVDIHGQNDNQAIFRTETHLSLLDRYIGEPLVLAMASFGDELERLHVFRKRMEFLGADPAERERTLDLLRYQVDEITRSAIQPEEDERLAARRKVVANSGRIIESLESVYELLEGDGETSVSVLLASAVSRIEAAARSVPKAEEYRQSLEDGRFSVENAAAGIRRLLDGIEIQPGELEEIDERLDVLFRLKKKYGGTLKAVFNFLESASGRLFELEDGEEEYGRLEKEAVLQSRLLMEKAAVLTKLRTEASFAISERIGIELETLGMKGVHFAVRITGTPEGRDAIENLSEFPRFSRSGLDQVEFLISPNPGEPLKPLARIASGGEAARIMLAIKSILADADRIPVLIFDEVDTGISGRTAGSVGEKLLRIAGAHQVLCVTHMAQIAAMADHQILIEKSTDGLRTWTSLRALDRNERRTELARLLSGGTGESEALDLAEKLLTHADSVRSVSAS
jgi:DNA repair protein RecN (Recombination protein N)